MISQTAEYALRAVVFLGENPATAHTTRAIALATGVKSPYLSKVLQGLSRAGLVTSQRGLGGGFTLARKPTELNLFDVLQAVDPPQRVHACPLKLKAHAVHLCPLHRRLDEAMARVEQSFRDTRLSDLLAETAAERMDASQQKGRGGEEENTEKH